MVFLQHAEVKISSFLLCVDNLRQGFLTAQLVVRVFQRRYERRLDDRRLEHVVHVSEEL